MSLKKMFDYIKFSYDFCKVKTVFYSVKLNIYNVYMVKTETLLFIEFIMHGVDREVLMTYMVFRRRWLKYI